MAQNGDSCSYSMNYDLTAISAQTISCLWKVFCSFKKWN